MQNHCEKCNCSRPHFERIKVHFERISLKKNMHRVQAGTQLFRKLSSHASETLIFSWRSKSILPGVKKLGFVRDVLHFSDPRDKEQHVIQNTKHCPTQMRKRTKVAYVCHFRAFQDGKDIPHAPHHQKKNAREREVEKREKPKSLARNAYFQGATRCR